MDKDLKIAYITPEAPPFSGGGIATFINNITRGMHQAGVYCEVFAPETDIEKTGITELNGVPMHRVYCTSSSDFRQNIVDYFLQRNKDIGFSIVESCEIHASLYELMRQHPGKFWYVIRVQMPVVYQLWLNHYYESAFRKIRYIAGAFRRFRYDLGFWNKVDVKRKKNPEYLVCEMADAIIAPSHSFRDWLVEFWKLPVRKISVIPHLFDFSTLGKCIESDNIDAEHHDANLVSQKYRTVSAQGAHEIRLSILFVGKLNAHKGVVNLAKAAQMLLPVYPQIKFILIGKDWEMPYGNKVRKTSEVLNEIVNDDRFILKGGVHYEDLPCYYEQADICIFPSLWEAWGYTCTEAMSYGKAVIGSKNGGMADAINHGKNGLLIDPFSIIDIQEKIEELITNPALRLELGLAAKNTIENELGFQKLVMENVAFYRGLNLSQQNHQD